MAGSRKNFIYTDDSTAVWGLSLDESNTVEVNGALGDLPIASTLNQGLPPNIKPRSLFFGTPDRRRVIRCVPLTPDIYTNYVDGSVPPTIPDPFGTGGTLRLIRAYGERRSIYGGADTGLDDGTPE